MSDVNMNSLHGKIEEDLKLKTLEKSSKPLDLPCSSRDFDFDSDVTASNCNNNDVANLFKTPSNYLTYDSDNNDDDSIHNQYTFKTYPNAREFEDVFEVEAPIPQTNSKNMRIMQSRINIFPVSNYKDFYDELVVETAKEEIRKRNGNSLASSLSSTPPRGCDCKIRVS